MVDRDIDGVYRVNLNDQSQPDEFAWNETRRIERSHSMASAMSVSVGGGSASATSSYSIKGFSRAIRRLTGKHSGEESVSSFETNELRTNQMWNDLMKEDWSDLSEDLNRKSCRDSCSEFWAKRVVRWSQVGQVVRRHPIIVLWTVLALACLTATGIVITIKFCEDQGNDRIDDATEVAVETGAWFSNELDRAILPLFSLAQFVHELEIFRELPEEIGQVGKTGSLPFLPPRTEGAAPTHRNITSVCDQPELVNRFNRIAATIKENAGMERVLVNLQLAPAAVVCLLYPVNNTEDFDDGIYMDNSGALGHDLLSDPDRKFISEATIPARKVVTAGPLQLKQCQDCHPTVEQAFIARLPIYMDEHSMTVGGEVYHAWGFAVALINWKELVHRSDIYERFSARGMQFQLTRTDRKIDPSTGEENSKIVVLAQSAEFSLDDSNSVSVELETTNNLWRMQVGYEEGFTPHWVGGAITGTVVLALLVTSLLFLLLVEKHSHGDLLHEMLPSRALRKLEKGEVVVESFNSATIFFSDIVGYTNMVSAMSPLEVMTMLNSFYSEMDRLAARHEVYKVETIGDAYMVSGGCPDRCPPCQAAEKVATFALDAIELVKNFEAPDGTKLFIRVGLNSGPVVAGVVGTQRPHYALFGDTVNTASRMESTSPKMRIQVSESTFDLLLNAPNYMFTMVPRGEVAIKGKGTMFTYWIESCKHKSELIGNSVTIPTNVDLASSIEEALSDVNGPKHRLSIIESDAGGTAGECHEGLMLTDDSSTKSDGVYNC